MTFNIKHFILFFSILLLAACSKEENPLAAPTIDDIEVGSDNNKTGYAGGDIHIEAEIIAPAKIASITVAIKPVAGTGWEFDTTYTEGFAGLLNTELHEHIDIPLTAATGAYQLTITVTDQAGKKTEVSVAIEIKLDTTLPALKDLVVSVSADKKELHLAGTIEATNKIANVELEVHGGNWEKDFDITEAAMVGQTSYPLQSQVNIAEAPGGHYHLHLKVTDQQGKEMEFESHFDKN